MKLVIIPPYRGVNYTPQEGHFLLQELKSNMEEKGVLDGVEIDIDDTLSEFEKRLQSLDS